MFVLAVCQSESFFGLKEYIGGPVKEEKTSFNESSNVLNIFLNK